MPYFDSYVRLEPLSPGPDLDEGFAAPVADPAWFLARQWQLGEHQGEDAGSPVSVEYRVTLTAITDPQGRAADVAPAEALIEASPFEWWTPARRARLGRAMLDRARRENPPLAERLDTEALRVRGLPAPYQFLEGRVPDGLAVYRARADLGVPDAWFSNLPEEARMARHDGWDERRFEYIGHLDAGAVRLDVEHQGGTIDWYSCDASIGTGRGTTAPDRAVALPARLDYAGAPAPRWWELENRRFDVGGFPPDRSHFATLLLIDVVSSHSDDWFVFPIDTTLTSLNQLVTVTSIRVRDSFGDEYPLAPPVDDWTLFEVDGLVDRLGPEARWSLPLLVRAVNPLAGAAIDEIDVNVDEDANLLWAVERRLNGLVPNGAASNERRNLGPSYEADTTNGVPQRYDPTTPLRPYWHPYVLATPNYSDHFTESIEGLGDTHHDS